MNIDSIVELTALETLKQVQTQKQQKQQSKPDFKPNEKLKNIDGAYDYAQSLQDELKRLQNTTGRIFNSNQTAKQKISQIHTEITKSMKTAQTHMDDYINMIWDKNTERGLNTVKSFGIPAKQPDVPSNVKTALTNWQNYAIYKVWTQLELDLVNQIYGKAYFEVAYNGAKQSG